MGAMAEQRDKHRPNKRMDENSEMNRATVARMDGRKVG
jgi:hypothetical protein